MERFVVLFITVLSGPLDGATTGLVYKSMDACEAARPVVIETITGQYEFSIDCLETQIVNASIRPMPRPEELP